MDSERLLLEECLDVVEGGEGGESIVSVRVDRIQELIASGQIDMGEVQTRFAEIQQQQQEQQQQDD